MEIVDYLNEKRKLVEERLEQYLPETTRYPSSIHEAMRYCVFSGGKRLRPILTIAAAEACGGKATEVLPSACAIELIHTYSLIHDDLPALDNDDYRRGKPSCHKAFGEAAAILAGDALLPLAFNLIAKNCGIDGIDEAKTIRVIKEVSLGIGSLGMVGGQVVDLESTTHTLTPPIIQYIHTHKTGTLFRAAVRCGAILVGANKDNLRSLTLYAENIGLAFQIVDDLLDLKEDKTTGERVNYPAVFGITASRDKTQELIGRAISALDGLEKKALALSSIARFIGERELI